MKQKIIEIVLDDRAIRRFWRNVALPNDQGCMLWIGRVGDGGYGLFNIGRVRFRANRVSCQIAYGVPDPETPYAIHSCRNKDCVSPGHLRWSTQKQNSLDMRRDGTAPVGTRHGRALLDPEAVQRIRSSQESADALAARYGVHVSTIRVARRRESWKNC